jgi:hypothetical protein
MDIDRETRVIDDAYDDGGQVRQSSRSRPSGRRRRGGCLTFILGLVLLLGIVAVVGDRIAASYATKALRTQLVSELQQKNVSYESLDVAIGGFPFLTQVARGNYDKITIGMANTRLPGLGGRVVTLPALDVVATGVNADTKQVIAGTAKVKANQITGTAVVAFSTLETLVDYSAYRLSEVKYSESGGGLHVTGKVNVGGILVPVAATADVSVAKGQFQVKLRDLEAVNTPAPTVVRQYLGNLAEQSLTAQLPALPFGLSLDGVKVEAAGLAITATGHDVPLVN